MRQTHACRCARRAAPRHPGLSGTAPLRPGPTREPRTEGGSRHEGGACSAPPPYPRSPKGKEELDKVAHRTPLSHHALYLDRCVVGAGVDKGQGQWQWGSARA
jgi:hypothetical protein